MIRRRALMIFAGAAALGLPAAACKRREMPKVELLDEDGTPPETEAISALAPPWPPAKRVVLGNDLLVHWLAEEDSPALHLRVLLPTHGFDDELAPGAAAVVAEALALELRRFTQRYGSTVELVSRVDRFEVAVHGLDSKTAAIVAALSRVISQEKPEALLLRARDAVVAGLPAIEAETLVLTTLVGILDGRDRGRDRLSREQVASLESEALIEAWQLVLDPRRALLVVHAGRSFEESAMARLAKAWTRGGILSGLGKAKAKAHDRLRPPSAKSKSKNKNKDKNKDKSKNQDEGREGSGYRLRGAPAAPLHLIQMSPGSAGGSMLMFGRILPLPTVADRARARLAQRLFQEEIDARLTIVGDRGLWIVKVPIRKSRPAGASKKTKSSDKKREGKDKKEKEENLPKDPRAAHLVKKLDEIREFIRTRAPRLRLAQAAELWLGARMVQASLTGEDWTALWSESIDLCESEAEIGGALARDAQAMLAIEPEELAEFTRRWLDYDYGQPGWAWVAASKEPDMAEALRQFSSVEILSP